MSLGKGLHRIVNWARKLMALVRRTRVESSYFAPAWESEDKVSAPSGPTEQHSGERSSLQAGRSEDKGRDSDESERLQPTDMLTELPSTHDFFAPSARISPSLEQIMPSSDLAAEVEERQPAAESAVLPPGYSSSPTFSGTPIANEQLSQTGPPDTASPIQAGVEVSPPSEEHSLPESESAEIAPVDEGEFRILPAPDETKQTGTEDKEGHSPPSLPAQAYATLSPAPGSPLLRPSAESRVKPAPTPQFDLTQHPHVSREELDEFLQRADQGELSSTDLTARRLDALLMDAFWEVDQIGELPISEQAFTQIARLMRDTFVDGNDVHIPRIWPALFITSMVFCARYSREDTRDFWIPYARLVWHLPEASQSFQNRCRSHFAHCRKYLEQQYGFKFPLIPGREGSVVKPVFYHAVIPFYLQNDFARWLTAHLDELCDYQASSLPHLLRDDPSLSQVPPSLQRFILEEDTAETAAELIAHLVEAAKLYQEGEDVTPLMVNPIQRALWAEIQKALEEKVEKEQIRRVPRPRLTWIWSLPEAELKLRLTSLYIDPRRHAPNLCVWTDKAEVNLSGSKVALPLNPFASHDKGWLVDEVFLAGGPLDGQIVVLSEEHEDEKAPDILYQADVPSLPQREILFFRLQQSEMGVLLEDNRRIVDGEWLISMAEGMELQGADGQVLAPIETRYVPDVLRQCCAHTKAGVYRLRLPVTVLQNGREILRLERNQDEIGQPRLEGPHLEAELSSHIPPVFTGLPVRLHIPAMEAEHLRHMTLAIRSNQPHSVNTLYELQANGNLTKTDDGQYVIQLDGLFPHKPGLYSIILRRNLKALLDEPLQFIFLPGVILVPPDQNQRYSPTNLPQAYIEGVLAQQVSVERHRAVCKPQERGVSITWRDLRDSDCSLRLEIEGQSIPLAWPITRIYAWVEGLSADGRLRSRNRDEAFISIRGQPNQLVSWRIANDGQERSFRLNARGQFDCKLSQDPLIDMIEQCPHTYVTVNVKAWDSEWKLFDYVRKPDFTLQRITFDSQHKLLVLESQVGHVREGDFRLQLLDLEATTEIPWVIGDFQRLEPHLSFEIELPPGHYCVQILSSGEPLDINPAVSSLRVVESPVPIQVGTPDDPLSVLVWPGTDIQRLLSEKVIAVPNLVQRLAAINRPDEWVGTYGLLPAWAVVGNPLILTTREHRVRLKVYPEMASHKGRAGKGYVDLDLEGDTPIRAYAAWKLRDGAGNALFSSLLEIRIPTHEVLEPFSSLDEDDLWPAYQCSVCGRIVGSRSGTYLKLSPSILNAHGHRIRYHDKRERFRDIVYGYDLHVSVKVMREEALGYVFSPCQSLDSDYLLYRLGKPGIGNRSQEASSPLDVEAYRLAVDEWLRNYRSGHRESVERLVGDRKWRESFERWDELRRVIDTEPMLAATNRLLDAIKAERPFNSPLVLLDRNMLMLALLLRSRASARRTYQELLLRSGLGEGDLRAILALALEACPLLLEWALTWVELFRVHAVS